MRQGFGPSNEELHPDRQQPGYEFEALPDGVVNVDDPTLGMVTSLPADKLPPGSWSLLKNARTRDDWVGRREGTAAIGAKPDSEPITKLITLVDESGSIKMLRITPTSVYVSSGEGTFDPVTHDLTGQVIRPHHARMFDWLFFAYAEEPVRVMNFQASSLMMIDEAPRAKAITNFGDRIVVGNLRLPVGGVRPNSIAWSANSDPYDWTSESSGMEDLVQGQGGYGDPIVALFGMGHEMIILRQRSIWHASRQAFATAPFRFFPVIANMGCDLPDTAVEAEGMIIWADQRTKGVYAYQSGSRPQKISLPINKELFLDLQNLIWAQAIYDPFEKEYHLGLSTSTTDPWITKVWVYSVEKGAWQYDDGPMISSMAITSMPENVTTIDELVGTIDGLTGTIDELSDSGALKPALYKGTATGELLQQHFDHDTDWDATAFEFEAISQNLGNPHRRRTFKDLLVKIVALVDGVVILDQSKNGTDWRNPKTNSVLASVIEHGIRLVRKLTAGTKLYWRIRCPQGQIRIRGYWVRLLEKGLQR